MKVEKHTIIRKFEEYKFYFILEKKELSWPLQGKIRLQLEIIPMAKGIWLEELGE